MGFLKAVFMFLRSGFVSQSNLAAENLALRQQLAVMIHSIKRVRSIYSAEHFNLKNKGLETLQAVRSQPTR
jgi:hypothetical protein